ncbi:uncharacterized protein K460DRAFT_391149 [Cucurbitaria berberidis CBS 394.84]|uniref:Protein kinase domain-containing protein n=1 Tax=Cucurbitaria berberidis CBS 394.84 TaxID=1168544 RepID=A0A9P4GQ94_9PLEO|nr:uncharacterized protein K460DRAFT_391149 [Cucurbitaria berberidis CBS 394.84]KAF1850713.1 hypothetical protein K460DRAFT_391149 [Cucurbitaria berberidis CBS 394.84]
MSAVGFINNGISLIEKSLAAYHAIADAKNFGSDAAKSVMMLRFEAFRYQEWGHDNKNITAIFQASNTAKSSQPPEAIGGFGAKQPISPVSTSCEALCDAVNQVIDVLQSVNQLLTKYNRAFESREQPGHSITDGISTTAIGAGGLQGKMHGASQRFEQLKDSLQSQTSLARRVKYGITTWNEADKEILKSLIQRFKYWNDSLYALAPPGRQDLQELVLAFRIVGAARSTAQLESVQGAAALSRYESMYRSATLKKNIGMIVGGPSLKKSYDQLSIDSKAAKSRRFITSYFSNDVPTEQVGSAESPSTRVLPERVLVEWYYYDIKWSPKQVLLADERVEKFAEKFSIAEKPANLPVMNCIGWVQHPTKTDRALLYRLVDTSSASSQIVTLNELLNGSHTSTVIRRPSLGDRFRLAAALTVGLLELHTVEWIHKGFGSHNVLLLYNPGEGVRYDKPFISGFDFARPDRPNEESLSMRPSKFDLYRHPDIRAAKLSSDAPKPSSSRMHDVYSLGLVLFEIGMWMPLESYVKANLTAEGFRERIQGYVDQDLAIWMGDRFANAVQSCLSGEYLLKSKTFPLAEMEEQVDDVEGMDEDFTSDQNFASVHQLAYFYRTIVSEIHGCQCEMGDR